MSEQVPSPSTEQPSLQQSLELTWSYLIDRFFAELTVAGRGNQEANFKTAFRLFRTSVGLTEESLVGQEFGDEFESKLKTYIRFQVERGLSQSTCGPRVSKIRELKRFAEANFEEILRLQTLPQSFGQKLHKLIVSSGFTIKSFWKTLPEDLVSYRSLLDWCLGRNYPCKKHAEVIKSIEKHLEVPDGTLRFNKYLRGGRGLKSSHSDSTDKARGAISKPYRVWTTSLEEEFQKLFSHKTEAILPEGEERHEKGQWTSSDGAGVPTARIIKLLLRSFMGFCFLPKDSNDPYLKGHGINSEELSLALLADKELVEDYLKFMRLRSGLRAKPVDKSKAAMLPTGSLTPNGRWEFYYKGGKYNKGALMTLISISSFLRPGTGYLYQHTEFAEKLGLRMKATSWHEQCVLTRTRINKLLRDIKGMKKNNDLEKFDFGRDPKERIGWILDLDRPLLLLDEMLKEMLVDLLPDTASMSERARQYRNILLFAMLCANPLRIRMFSIMEFDKNLLRKDDGSWRLRFRKGAFKNRSGLKSEYEVGVARELWPMLDRYKEEFHPILAGSSGSRYVFTGVGCRGRGGRKQGAPLNSESLSHIVKQLTGLYVPGEVGFGPHSFRHIVATDIIKKDPRIGFFLAARALHDKLETVENEYIHLKTSEFFEPVNTHFAEAWNQIFGLPLAA
jgi:integrase